MGGWGFDGGGCGDLKVYGWSRGGFTGWGGRSEVAGELGLKLKLLSQPLIQAVCIPPVSPAHPYRWVVGQLHPILTIKRVSVLGLAGLAGEYLSPP